VRKGGIKMAISSFYRTVIIKDEAALRRLEAAEERGCRFENIKALTTKEMERRKKAAKEWMSRR
jgi:hypothetical protein